MICKNLSIDTSWIDRGYVMPDDRVIIKKLRSNRSNLAPARIMSADDVGSYVKQARKEIGLTQKEAALISGVGLSFIHDLEHGKKTIQFDSLMRVITRLDCELTINSKSGHLNG